MNVYCERTLNRRQQNHMRDFLHYSVPLQWTSDIIFLVTKTKVFSADGIQILFLSIYVVKSNEISTLYPKAKSL